MARALFIKRNDIITFTQANGNIDYDKFEPALFMAQDRDIYNLLGTDLYQAIESKILATTLAGDYATLVNDYIKYVLLWSALSEALPFIAFSVQNGGVFQHQSEAGVAATRSDVEYLVQKARNNAVWYTQRLTDYLCANSNLFPEYYTNSNGDLSPDRNQTNAGGWVL